MARFYDDIYFTNCNGELHLQLDGPTGTGETVTGAAYFRVRMESAGPVYVTGYTGNGCADGWITSLDYTFSDQFQLSNEDDLDLVFDLNDSNSTFLAYYDTTTTEGNSVFEGDSVSDCLANNWWKDGLRMGGAGNFLPAIRLLYYRSDDSVITGTSYYVGTNLATGRSPGQEYIYNAPPGTSGRALIDDDNTARSGTPYGVTSTPLQSMATTSGCTGDPHVTTFDGCKYTL